MDRLPLNASQEDIVNKINEIINDIEKYRISLLEEEIRRIQHQTENDKFFREVILPALKTPSINDICNTKNI